MWVFNNVPMLQSDIPVPCSLLARLHVSVAFTGLITSLGKRCCTSPAVDWVTRSLNSNWMGRYGSGGKSGRLAVGGLPVRSHPGRVEVSLSETPNPQLLLTSWLVPCMAANRWCVNVCVNERHKLYSYIIYQIDTGWWAASSVVVKLLYLDPQGRWFNPWCGHDSCWARE